MRTKMSTLLVGFGILGMGFYLFVSERSRAGENKEIKAAILKIAETLEKGDAAGAKKHSEALGKKLEELLDVMDLFKPRKRDGLGVGPKEGVIVPDGIELKLLALGRDALSAAALGKESAALEQLGYHTAAIMEITLAKTPPKDEPKKLKKDWVLWTKDAHAASLELAKAAKAKDAQALKAAAMKVNAACNMCHSTFRN